MPSQPSFEFLALASCIPSNPIQSVECHIVAHCADDCPTEFGSERKDIQTRNAGSGKCTHKTRPLCNLETLEEANRRNRPVESVASTGIAVKDCRIRNKNKSAKYASGLASGRQEQPCVHGCILDILPWVACVFWIISILLS